MGLWAVLLTGLFAGGASCAAVQGGLLAGTLTRRRPGVATEARAPKADNPSVRPGLARARLDETAPVGAFLAGKLVSHAVLGAALGLVDAPTAVAAPPVAADGIQRILIEAHDTAYSPSAVTARAGVPTGLTIRTANTRGCTRAIVLSSLGIRKALPATGDTHFALGPLEPGTYRYTCGMGMYGGSIRIVA